MRTQVFLIGIIVVLLGIAFTPNAMADTANKTKIVLLAEQTSQDEVADVVLQELNAPAGTTLRTLLPAKAEEVRQEPAKASELGYSHILYVRVRYTSSRRGEYILHQAHLSLRLFEVSSEEIVKSWTHRGVGFDQISALELASERAANILEELKEE